MKHPAIALVALLSMATAGRTQTLRRPDPPDPLAPRPRDRAWSEVMDRLLTTYGKVITFEDPILNWTGDLADSGNGLEAGPKQFYFDLPSEIGSEPDLGAVLAKTLAAYRQQTDGPRFQVLTSELGLHVVPVQVRDADGKMGPTRNPLDEYIVIPEEERTPEAHLSAICAAVAAQTGINYTCFPTVIRPNAFQRLFGGNATLKWGAPTRTVARTALVDLLNRSESSLTWQSRCSYAPLVIRDAGCVLSVGPIEVTVAGPDGKPSKKMLMQDRCKKCSAPR